MTGASKALEARFELAGYANFFLSATVVTTKELGLLQTCDYRTLLCIVVLRGTGGLGAWRTAVADITAGRGYATTPSQPRTCQALGRADHSGNNAANA